MSPCPHCGGDEPTEPADGEYGIHEYIGLDLHGFGPDSTHASLAEALKEAGIQIAQAAEDGAELTLWVGKVEDGSVQQQWTLSITEEEVYDA